MSEQNLLLALDDEYRAYSFYASVRLYGQIFVNLCNAKQTHIEALKWHLQNLGITIPSNPYGVEFANFSSIEEILQTALINENANVEAYNTLIDNEEDSNVLDTFYHLQAASFNHHIPALQNMLAQVKNSPQDSMQNLQSAIQTMNEGKAFLNETNEVIAKMQRGDLSQMELENFLNKCNLSLVGGLIVGALGASLLNEFLNQNKE